MDLSIIIAHFNPDNFSDCIDFFHKTLSIISDQKNNLNIEIIIGDDGSPNNKNFIKNHSETFIQSREKIYCLSGKKLKQWKLENKYNYPDITKWLYYPKINKSMNKARLGNVAINLAKSENLLFLDDDNYFISQDSLQKILQLLNNYNLVFGQIQDSNGRYRPYSSHRVQGTTFAIKKELIKEIGGFGEWTESISCGVDSDLWWKLYHCFKQNLDLKACYTSSIQTKDSCSKRWNAHIKKYFRHYFVKKAFNKIHGCINYRSTNYNFSRIKSNWMDDLT